MQNRKSNDIDQNNADKGNHFWRNTIGVTAPYFGFTFHSGNYPYFFPHGFAAACTISVGVYGIKRWGSICSGKREDLNRKSEAKIQAAIAATAFGASALLGSSDFWYRLPKTFIRAGFSTSSIPRLEGIAGLGATIAIGFSAPILIDKIKNRSQLKEQAKFFLFGNRSKHVKLDPPKHEEVKNTNSSLLRK